MNTVLPEKAYQTICQGPIKLASNKTKIVCTIGPASESPEILLELIQSGMNIARLNFSHGDFSWHQNVIQKLRRAALLAGQRMTILADLPGPKMRIGPLETEPVYLRKGDLFNLTSEAIMGNQKRVSVSFQNLASVVSPGDLLSLNDGIIQLEVLQVVGSEVQCQLRVGGRVAFPQRHQPAWHQFGYQCLYRTRQSLSLIRIGKWRGCDQPIFCGKCCRYQCCAACRERKGL
jgi:hypothetical protein